MVLYSSFRESTIEVACFALSEPLCAPPPRGREEAEKRERAKARKAAAAAKAEADGAAGEREILKQDAARWEARTTQLLEKYGQVDVAEYERVKAELAAAKKGTDEGVKEGKKTAAEAAKAAKAAKPAKPSKPKAAARRRDEDEDDDEDDEDDDDDVGALLASTTRSLTEKLRQTCDALRESERRRTRGEEDAAAARRATRGRARRVTGEGACG